MVRTLGHPLHGEVSTIGFPVKFSRTTAEIARAAPLYGQHTREVLAACGYSEAQIDAMLAAGAAVATDAGAVAGAQGRGRAAT